MKRLRVLLLASTFFVTAPIDAHAMPPVVAFVAGAGAALFGGAPLVLGGIAATTSAYAAGAFVVQAALGVLGSTLGAVLLNAAVGLALNSFVKQPGVPDIPRPKPQELQSNFTLSDQPRFVLWGPNRVGGGISFGEAKGGKLYKQPAHGDSEATSEIGLWLNDIPVSLDGNNYVEQEEFVFHGTKYIRIFRRPGTATQAAQSQLTSVFPEWTSGHVGAGVADSLMIINPVSQEARQYIYKHRGVFGLGEPDLTRAAYWGRAHDPRVPSSDAEDPSTWPASNGNPALIWAAHRMDIERFANSAAEINWDSVATAADVCDVAIVDRYGVSAPQYRCGIAINKREEKNIDAENRILSSFDGMRFEDSDGRIGIIAGTYYEPDVTLTDDDLIEVASAEADDGESTFTHFYAEYTEPGYGWKGQTSAEYVHPDWQEGDRVKSTSVSLFPVYLHRQAVQLVKVAANRQNEKRRLAVIAGLRARRLKERRTVRIVSAIDPGINGVYEVAGFKREQGQLFSSLALIKIGSDWWTLGAGEEGERPNLTVAVENDNSLTNISPGNMSIQAASIAVSGGNAAARFVAAFPAPSRADRVVQIQYRKKTTSTWEEMSVRAEDGAAASDVVSDGDTYEFRWRVWSIGGDVSSWSSIVEVVAVADQSSPGTLQAFSVSSPSAGNVTVAFTSPDSSNYFATRIYRAGYAPGYSGPYDFGDASQVRDEPGFKDTADSWQDTGLATGHYAYWAEPLNGSGGAGTRSGPQTVNVA